jgi:hypothetical protein
MRLFLERWEFLYVGATSKNPWVPGETDVIWRNPTNILLSKISFLSISCTGLYNQKYVAETKTYEIQRFFRSKY